MAQSFNVHNLDIKFNLLKFIAIEENRKRIK